jgi:hypothetical protein
MIELTEKERQYLDEGKAVSVQEDGREYVLLRRDVYERLAEESHNDDSWSAEEMDRLREESVSHLDRYGMDGGKQSVAMLF